MKNSLVLPVWALRLNDFDQLSSPRLSVAPRMALFDHLVYWAFAILSLLTLPYVSVNVISRLVSAQFVPTAIPAIVTAYVAILSVYVAYSIYKRFKLTREVMTEYGSWNQIVTAAKALAECRAYGESRQAVPVLEQELFEASMVRLKNLRQVGT